MYDLIIRHARVFDGADILEGVRDIAICGGQVAAMEPELDAETEAARTFEARGMLVTPGLVDFHLHLSNMGSIGVDARTACLPYGVVAALEAGSAGALTFEGGLERPAPGIAVRYLLNVCSAGLSSLRSYPENIDPRYYDEKRIEALFTAYPELLAGLKIRMGAECSLDMGTEPLRCAVRLARRLSSRVMVHVSAPAMQAGCLADLLGEGDIFTHTYQGRGNGILLPDGTLDPRVMRARERGVLFDVGDARIHMSFSVFRQAAAQGFYPDTCGSDITDAGVFDSGVFALPVVISKLVTLGMPEREALAAATSTPARLCGLDGYGTLRAGGPAHLAAFRVLHGAGSFTDGSGERISADYLLSPMLTVLKGRIAWRSAEARD